MRIAFIYPATPFDLKYHADALPTGLLYLTAVAERRCGASVDVFDSRHGPAAPSPDEARRYDLIGFTGMSMQASTALRLARSIRRGGYEGPMAFGGPHASVAPEHLTAQSDLDAVFVGEAEDTFVQYLRYLEGKPHSLQRVWLKGGDGEWNYLPGDDYIADLDSLPFPEREKYGDLTRRIRFINLMTARGCPFKCEYCQPTKEMLFGKKVRRRSVDNIVAEIENAAKRFDITSFSIDDDTFTFQKRPVLEFCEQIKPLGLRWSCQSRSDIDCETLAAMRDSGLTHMNVGVESGSQRILDLMNKRNTVEQNETFLNRCREIGVDVWCNMMIGYPGETEEDMRQSLEFVKRVKPTRVCVSQVTPFPGTHVWNKCRDDIIEQDWNDMARHVYRPKFKSMAPLQRLISYYGILMSREWGEPLTADFVQLSGFQDFLARRSRRLIRLLVRRASRRVERLREALEAARAGRVDEGVARLEAIKRRHPTYAEPLGHLAWLYRAQGRLDLAAENYRRLLALAPEDAEARRLLDETLAAINAAQESEKA